MSIKEIRERHNEQNLLRFCKNHKKRIKKLEEQIERVRPYLQHKRDCAVEVQHYAFEPECDCGLEKLMEDEI